MIGYAGYAPHRPGRIHLFCPACRRKQSNTPRTRLDPPKAVLARVLCGRCDVGTKDGGQSFLNAYGRPLCSFCGRARCERVGGSWECTEALLLEPSK